MAKNDFIPVAADDWYQRRRQDTEGEFFRKVADQSPRKGAGGSTRQGIYCLTADGKLLAYKNAGQDANVMREVFQQSLAAFRRLPESQRKPRISLNGEPSGVSPRLDRNYVRTPPANGLILTVHTRILDRQTDGAFCKGTCDRFGLDWPARDHLWLTADEWKSLVPSSKQDGESFPLPPAIAERLLRFHLVDNTRGEPPFWRRDEIRKQNLMLTVTKRTDAELEVRLEGAALIATDADVANANRGFDAKLLGFIRYDAAKRAITRFDMVAVGEHWGEGTFTRGARPGRTPLGIAFELATGEAEADKVPPQAAREIREYLGSNR